MWMMHSTVRLHGPTERLPFADVEVVLTDPLALTTEDPDAKGERRFLTIGADAFGRIPAVIYTYRTEAQVRLISARRATRIERKYYARGI